MFTVAAALLLLLPHDEKRSFSRVAVGPGGVEWTIELPTEGLAKVLKLPAEPLELVDEDLPDLRAELEAYLARAVALAADGKAVPLKVSGLDPVRELHLASGKPYIAHVRVKLSGAMGEPSVVVLSAALFATVTDAHKAAFQVQWAGRQRVWSRSGPFELEISRQDVAPTFLGTVGVFLLWGMEHIFIGADHIAFLLALLLAASKMGEMVRIVTSFTVAHSLTLLLASLDVIRLAPALTEAMIAASIVYVAVENLVLKETRHRWVLTFVFGLVHGLGFSGVLREKLEGLDGILLPVVSFNFGVELGQVAILLVVFPLLALVRRAPEVEAVARRQRLLVRLGSVPILLLGAGWLADRIFGLGLMPI
jgi:hydrogenase/urease accessory protein HupE